MYATFAHKDTAKKKISIINIHWKIYHPNKDIQD